MVEVALFCEDRGHEAVAGALARRLAGEVGLEIQLRGVSAAGGKGLALSRLRAWQRSFARGIQVGRPDVVIIVIDGNCTGHAAKHREIEALVDPSVFPRWVIGCPDPHVERWCFADVRAYEQIVGRAPPADPGKCERSAYKSLLRDSLAASGVTVLTGEMEIAPDLIQAADLYEAGKTQASLGAFVDDLRTAFAALRGAQSV